MKWLSIIFFCSSAFAADFGAEYAPVSVTCPMYEGPSFPSPKVELKRINVSNGQAEYNFIFQANSKSEIINMKIKSTDLRVRIGRETGKTYHFLLLAEGEWNGSKRKVQFTFTHDSIYSLISIQDYVGNASTICEMVVPPLKLADKEFHVPGLESYSIKQNLDKTEDIWPLEKSNETLRMLVRNSNKCWAPEFEISSNIRGIRYLEKVLSNDGTTPRCWNANGVFLDEKNNLFIATDGALAYFWQLSDGKLMKKIEVNEINGIKLISLRKPFGIDSTSTSYWFTAESYGGGNYFLVSVDRASKKISSYIDLSETDVKSVSAFKDSAGRKRIFAYTKSGKFVVMNETAKMLFETSDARAVFVPDEENMIFVIRGADRYDAWGEITAYSINFDPLWKQSFQMFVAPGGMAFVDGRIVIAGLKSRSGFPDFKSQVLAYNVENGKPQDLQSVDILQIYQDYSDTWITPDSRPLSTFVKGVGNKLFSSISYLSTTGSGDTNSIEKLWKLPKSNH